MKYFYKIGSAKGRAICRLALVRVQCEIELNKDANSRDLKHLIAIADKARLQFHKIGYKLGEDRANLYIDFLQKKIKGEEDSSFKKLVKFKTLKRNHIEKVKAGDSLIEQNILKDEDIRLFVEIIEEDADLFQGARRYSSCSSVARSTMKNSSMKYDNTNTLNLQKTNSELSVSISGSKFKKNSRKQIKLRKAMKKFMPIKKSSETPNRSRVKKKDIINLEKIPSLIAQDSTDTNDNY